MPWHLVSVFTIKPILRKNQPFERRRDTTYLNHVTAEKENSDGTVKRRVRGTAGGDRSHYPFDVSAKTADMEMVKLLVQGAASDRKRDPNCGKFSTMDIKDFYLAAPMDRPEYIRVKIGDIPTEIVDEYGFSAFVEEGSVLFQVDNCMYGYPQSGLLSQERLFSHLENNGYRQQPNIPCLFRHESRDVIFVLVVDDFAVKYSKMEDFEMLVNTLKELYELTINLNGSKYLGYDIQFDDEAHTVSLSMPNYVPKLLERFYPGQTLPGISSPAVYKPPRYGSNKGLVFDSVGDDDDSPPLSEMEITRLQEIIGTLLFYARAVDYTILTAVSHLSSKQSHPTQNVLADANRILRYLAAYPQHILVFRACDMQLRAHSDASYCTRSNSRSVAGGIFYCADSESPSGYINGGILAVSTIIPTVCASVAEAEYAALFLDGQHAIWIRILLEAMGYKQVKPTLMVCDNSCAVGIANKSVKLKRSKAINMRYHWIRDQIRQGTIQITWLKGTDNFADFFTKALPVRDHQMLKSRYVSFIPNASNPSLNRTARWKQNKSSEKFATSNRSVLAKGVC